MQNAMRTLAVLIFIGTQSSLLAETLRQPKSFQEQLLNHSPSYLAAQARSRGDARRGALVYFKSAAACVNCHEGEGKANPLGPALAKLGEVTDEHLVEALLAPSKKIREGYQTHSFLLEDGTVLSGLIVRKTDRSIVIRSASDLTVETEIALDEIEHQQPSPKSMMPEGLAASLAGQRDFLDLIRYLIDIAAGGPDRARELRPTPDQLAIRDDSADLDHAGIIGRFRSKDYEAGKGIYHGYCFNCHGSDGNTPSLPTARAFGTQKLKFGSDPYRMFMTLTRGNGLMAPMSHLTPKERYQVVHYIREQFMKPSNSDYFKVDDDYLSGLPKGTKDGTEVQFPERDFGPALASQLERRFSSVLTIKLGDVTVSYDLHSMNQADLWQGGFLDLSQTQHARPRGEGTANPMGERLTGLGGWAWGHGGTLDYPRAGLLPRGPLPKKWMDYKGHYLHGQQVVLRYAIDEREILESPSQGPDDRSIRQTLRIGPGRDLVLALAAADKTWKSESINPSDSTATIIRRFRSPEGDDSLVIAAGVTGDVDCIRLSLDDSNRLRMEIPADDHTRQITVHRLTGQSSDTPASLSNAIATAASDVDLETATRGGPTLWPDVLTTTGYLGLEKGAYALDTITIPDSTPWNTWFRTSALDFFPDGRMAVATHGGDVWIVSGIDDTLAELKWKRFAGGLYEPFGLKIVDGLIYVTCKDRLTRLHDQDGNGEADFYESFSADQDVSVNFHAFNFDLQTDDKGNFYYAKSGHGTDSEIPGAVIKVSADGQDREVFCTGFRTPNGMGSLPDGRVTVSDNQGQWTPASKINLVRPGGFYGWVANYSIPGMWEPGGGTIDLAKVVPPKTFDPPLVWMPQEFDNSCGGQAWVDDERWGPLSGRLLHTSFGKGWMFYTMIQDLREGSQAAIIKLPFNFRTGIMRARTNPADGQVYATGLQGWNGGGRVGLLDRGIQRIRYTKNPFKMVRDCKVEPDGLRLEFNFRLDTNSATDPTSYDVKHWNYRWAKSYGSDMYSPSTGEKGVDPVEIDSVSLGVDGKSVKLNVSDLQPVNQVHILLKVKTSDGDLFEEEIYWTINHVPER